MATTLSFDENGLLVPRQIIACDLASIENALVDGFPDSATRRVLFNHFLRYLDSFRSKVSREFVL